MIRLDEDGVNLTTPPKHALEEGELMQLKTAAQDDF